MAIAAGPQRSGMRNSSALKFLFVLPLMTVCLIAAQAQSGRSTGHRNPSSVPAADPTPPAQTQRPSNAAPSQKLSFIVTKYVQGPNVTIETSTAFNSFVRRLSDSTSVEVTTLQTDMTRKQGIDRAKSEESAYVVWLRMEVDTVDTERAIAGAPINPGCVFLSYTVYFPQTAKVKAQGRVYQRGYSPNLCVAATGGNPIPRGEPAHLPYEYRIEVAGRDAADRVLQAFELNLPSIINSSTDDLR